ncbi:MAG TPA: helix-turn-helix domain-containing protein [Candidatus Elarobacter sp.]|jgi:AcrR family transcriptional regulator
MAAVDVPRGSLGDHIASVAAKLFYREGINVVGVDRVAAEAEVTKRTLYRYFRSKDELIVAALKRGPRVRFPAEGTPKARMLGAFDMLIAFLDGTKLRGCPFMNGAAELADPRHPGREVVRRATERRRAWFRALAEEAGAPAQLGEQLDVLFDGALASSMIATDLAPARAALAAAKALVNAAT